LFVFLRNSAHFLRSFCARAAIKGTFIAEAAQQVCSKHGEGGDMVAPVRRATESHKKGLLYKEQPFQTE